MTGEKLRSLRRDHKPSKEDGDLLGPGEEEAAAAPGGGAFTAGRAGSGKGGRAGSHRIFTNHHRLPLKAGPGSTSSSLAAGGLEPDKCPAAHFPVHECVFKGDVRRLSALIRTQGIGQKDSHGKPRRAPFLSLRPYGGGTPGPPRQGLCERQARPAALAVGLLRVMTCFEGLGLGWVVVY